MTDEELKGIARVCAKAKPQSYYTEPFEPHEWVMDALRAVADGGKGEAGEAYAKGYKAGKAFAQRHAPQAECAPREAQPDATGMRTLVHQIVALEPLKHPDNMENAVRILSRVIAAAGASERADAEKDAALTSGVQMDDVSPLVDEWIRSRGTQMDGASYGAAVELSAFIKSKVIERADAEKDAALTNGDIAVIWKNSPDFMAFAHAILAANKES